MPIVPEANVTNKPMEMEFFAPMISCPKTSRPPLSVPSNQSDEGGLLIENKSTLTT